MDNQSACLCLRSLNANVELTLQRSLGHLICSFQKSFRALDCDESLTHFYVNSKWQKLYLKNQVYTFSHILLAMKFCLLHKDSRVFLGRSSAHHSMSVNLTILSFNVGHFNLSFFSLFLLFCYFLRRGNSFHFPFITSSRMKNNIENRRVVFKHILYDLILSKS